MVNMDFDISHAVFGDVCPVMLKKKEQTKKTKRTGS